MELNRDFLDSIKGFLDEREGRKIYDLALEAGRKAPLLEVGSYCGKSAMYLGSAAKKNSTVLYSIDHHRGSEEQQKGEAYFDPELYDEKNGCIDTLPMFRKSLEKANLDNYVIPIVAESRYVSKEWGTSLGLVFVDGSHAFESAMSDYTCWRDHITKGGYLVFHDIFLNPDEGGQAPRKVYETAATSGLFEVLPMFMTLGILRKK